MARGLFAEHGLEVSLLEPAGGPENIRRVAEGGAEACLTSVNHYMTARQSFGELPARFVAIVTQQHPIAGLVRAASPATLPADLTGLRLGGSTANGLTRELLAGLAHLSVDPPHLVEVDYADGPGALGRGDIDVIADFADLVPRIRRQAGVDVRAIRVGVPVYATGLVAADRLGDDVVARLRAAMVEVLQAHRADPSASLDEFARRYPGVAADEALEGWAYAAESIFTGAPVGEMTHRGWEATREHVERVHGWAVPAAAELYRANCVSESTARTLTGVALNRRRLAALCVSITLMAAGCGGGGGDSPAAQSSEPAADQSIVVGYTTDQYVLEGPRASLGMYPLNANIVETLTYLTPDYKVEPLLAERWELIQPNTWRFHLRTGVTFHDGQPFNAEAVKGMFARVAEIKGGGTIKAGPESAVVVDDSTIDFTPIVPNLRVPEQLVHPNNGIVAPGSTIGVKPVGTGPFTFVEYQPNERISVQRNPEYWGGAAKLERIEFRFYPDSNARKLALESGDADVIYDLPRPDAADLQSRDFTVVNSPVGAYEAMYANAHGKAPFDKLTDVRLRRAVAMSIDRKALVDGVLDGLATTDQTFVPPTSLGKYAKDVKGNPFDPEAAEVLLDEAGWKAGGDGVRTKDGQRLGLTLVSGFPTAEVHRPIPAFLQSQLAEVGIALEIVERPDSASFQAVIASGEGDLFLEQGSQNDANPGFLPVLLFYTGGSGASAPYQTLFAPGKKFDELIEPSLSAADPDVVRRTVSEALREAIEVQATVIPLAGIFRTYGLRPQVKGFVEHASSLNLRWDDVWLSAS